MLTSRDANHPGNLAILVFDLWACNVSAKLLHGDGFVCINTEGGRGPIPSSYLKRQRPNSEL